MFPPPSPLGCSGAMSGSFAAEMTDSNASLASAPRAIILESELAEADAAITGSATEFTRWRATNVERHRVRRQGMHLSAPAAETGMQAGLLRFAPDRPTSAARDRQDARHEDGRLGVRRGGHNRRAAMDHAATLPDSQAQSSYGSALQTAMRFPLASSWDTPMDLTPRLDLLDRLAAMPAPTTATRPHVDPRMVASDLVFNPAPVPSYEAAVGVATPAGAAATAGAFPAQTGGAATLEQALGEGRRIRTIARHPIHRPPSYSAG